MILRKIIFQSTKEAQETLVCMLAKRKKKNHYLEHDFSTKMIAMALAIFGDLVYQDKVQMASTPSTQPSNTWLSNHIILV